MEMSYCFIIFIQQILKDGYFRLREREGKGDSEEGRDGERKRGRDGEREKLI